MTVAAILLSNGDTALVDDADLAALSRHRWHSNGAYAYRCTRVDGRRRSVYMHREIMDAPDGVEVDHLNGVRLDNRRVNMRLANRAENQQNLHGARVDSQTGVRGVQRTPNGTYRVRVWVDGRQHNIGTYASLGEANEAARAARRELMTHSVECGEAA